MIYGMSPQIKRLRNKPRQVITGRVMEMLIVADGFSLVVLPSRGFSGLYDVREFYFLMLGSSKTSVYEAGTNRKGKSHVCMMSPNGLELSIIHSTFGNHFLPSICIFSSAVIGHVVEKCSS